ncbi:MAG: response regulator [Thermodesulfobacteriota bacterium]|nr:response regulator [Thermodesulfobacteriota bacterium]
MSQHRILIVDPFKNIQNAYQMVLEAEKFEVDIASGPEEANGFWKRGQYSVIITEYCPPDEMIDELIRMVKREHPETYMMMVTQSLIEESLYEKYFTLGLDDFILKPFSPERILVHIRKGLRMRDLILQKKELESMLGIELFPEELEHYGVSSAYFKKCLRQELKRAKRHRYPLSLLLIGIPGRGGVNRDRGDDLFIELAKTVRSHIRVEDLVGRENGSLGIILPHTDESGSVALIQRIIPVIQTQFQLDKGLMSVIDRLSYQSFTYPDRVIVPESLRNIFEEVESEFPSR